MSERVPFCIAEVVPLTLFALSILITRTFGVYGNEGFKEERDVRTIVKS